MRPSARSVTHNGTETSSTVQTINSKKCHKSCDFREAMHTTDHCGGYDSTWTDYMAVAVVIAVAVRY